MAAIRRASNRIRPPSGKRVKKGAPTKPSIPDVPSLAPEILQPEPALLVPEVRAGIIEGVNEAQMASGKQITPISPAPVMAGKSETVVSEQVKELAQAIAEVNGSTGKDGSVKNIQQEMWTAFPSGGGLHSLSLANEGASSLAIIDFGLGTISLDGVVIDEKFAPLGRGAAARFFQMNVSNSCKMAVNDLARGLFDVSAAASPIQFKGYIERVFISFTVSTLKIGFFASTLSDAIELSGGEQTVRIVGQMIPIHGASATSTDVSDTDFMTLSSAADNTEFDVANGNNTIDYTWESRQRLAGYLFHATDGSTQTNGISEELGLQYRPSAGGITTDANWSVYFFRRHVSNCTDFAYFPEQNIVFEAGSTIRFNITAQNYHMYASSTASLYPTMLVEE